MPRYTLNKKVSKKLIAPSILSADFSCLADEIKAVTKAGADWIHCDVMDGHFVPNLTFGPPVVASLAKVAKIPLDAHLMISNPEKYIESFAKAGAWNITIHCETTKNAAKLIAQIHEQGVSAGISVSPETDVRQIESVLPMVDLVLVMTVSPGFGGQKMIESCIDKISWLARHRKERKLNYLIEADGGITADNADRLAIAGCDVFVAGSAIFRAKNYSTAIKQLRKAVSI